LFKSITKVDYNIFFVLFFDCRFLITYQGEEYCPKLLCLLRALNGLKVLVVGFGALIVGSSTYLILVLANLGCLGNYISNQLENRSLCPKKIFFAPLRDPSQNPLQSYCNISCNGNNINLKKH
jgi:hypothetical protein